MESVCKPDIADRIIPLYSLISRSMKKIISISISAVLIASGLLMMTSQERNNSIILEEAKEDADNDSANYSNFVEFNQEMLQLHKEVIQFEITFHQDDVVDISLNMFVSYIDETITSVYCLLTDGKKPLLEPRMLWYVPERKYTLVTPKIRLSVGKFWFIKLLNDNEGKIRFGSAYNDSGRFDVHSGDTWYLTCAVPTSGEKSGYIVILKSLYNSMEVKQITRHSDIDLYTANYNQFSGKYYAVKFHILGGFSICDVNKQITTIKGTIMNMYVGGHRKGKMKVTLPDGEEKQFSQKGLMTYSILGKESGTWKFTVRGWSIYFRMQVVLIYIDIDPRVQSSQAK
ncbi:MAG TPA: hypothetical protein HA260_02265 [Thermoplasmata archaeon]|nr:hypothetical protein [Thermoplasmata archaeon]